MSKLPMICLAIGLLGTFCAKGMDSEEKWSEKQKIRTLEQESLNVRTTLDFWLGKGSNKHSLEQKFNAWYQWYQEYLEIQKIIKDTTNRPDTSRLVESALVFKKMGFTDDNIQSIKEAFENYVTIRGEITNIKVQNPY